MQDFKGKSKNLNFKYLKWRATDIPNLINRIDIPKFRNADELAGYRSIISMKTIGCSIKLPLCHFVQLIQKHYFRKMEIRTKSSGGHYDPALHGPTSKKGYDDSDTCELFEGKKEQK